MKYYKLNINSLTKEDYERIFQEVDEYRQKKWKKLTRWKLLEMMSLLVFY